MGYQDAIDYLYGRIDYERTTNPKSDYSFRLERTVELFEKLGLDRYLHRPDQESEVGDAVRINAIDRPKVPLIHIAGTKGKGSTATMISQILSTAGYRVGLYTSPHVTDVEERFRSNGEPCRRSSLDELVESICPVVQEFDSRSGSLSFFELTTAMAVLHFDRNDCDVIVLEVGLGGRLDSTNVCASSLAAITSIGLDHQRVLGDTIGEIAAEKAGIIKAAVPVVSGVIQPAAAEQIRLATTRRSAELLERDSAFTVRDRRSVAGGTEFVYCSSSDKLTHPESAGELPLFLSLLGDHQVDNAAIAISVIRRLFGILPVTDSQIAQGLREVRCIARLERFSLDAPSIGGKPIQILIDTAHNHDSIRALCDAVRSRIPPFRKVQPGFQTPEPGLDSTTGKPDPTDTFHRPIVVVFATSRDKDLTSMALELTKVADKVICTRFTTNPRYVDIDQLTSSFSVLENERAKTMAPDLGTPDVTEQADPHLALKEAIVHASPNGTVIVCGSFFLAGQLRPDLLGMPDAKRLLDAGTTNPVASSTLPANLPRPLDGLNVPSTTVDAADSRGKAQ